MFQRLFTDHPRAVGETYAEHFAVAARFGTIMLGGALGALIHALVPGLCGATGSKTLARLNVLMDDNRNGKTGVGPDGGADADG